MWHERGFDSAEEHTFNDETAVFISSSRVPCSTGLSSTSGVSWYKTYKAGVMHESKLSRVLSRASSDDVYA